MSVAETAKRLTRLKTNQAKSTAVVRIFCTRKITLVALAPTPLARSGACEVVPFRIPAGAPAATARSTRPGHKNVATFRLHLRRANVFADWVVGGIGKALGPTPPPR
jgi:hypothetical protein